MKSSLIIAGILFVASAGLHAEDYSVWAIPDHLKENADYVIRKETQVFDVSSPSKATETRTLVVTIFNRRADFMASFSESYDNSSKIKSIKGVIYDQTGKVHDKIKKSAVNDVAIYRGQFIEDMRRQFVEYTPPFYPITVEYEIEILYNGILSYPNWQPRDDTRMSVQLAEFTLSVPESMPVRYKQIHLDCKPDIQTDGGKKTYTWKVENLPAFKEWELFSGGITPLNGILFTAPVDFEYEGYPGSLKDWQSMGKWVYDLNKGRDELPESTKLKIREMTEGLSLEKKVEKLYQYLQKKTRYVGIQLGIGGFQSFEATFVDEYGYGDCKALSNYMKALLKAVDIPSNLIVIRAGAHAPDIQVDFPDFQFNHMILCVPTPADTIWLECTSQNNPFGYMGSFTSDRHALLITENGGRIVRTRSYDENENYEHRYAEVQINESGDAVAEVETKYSGLNSSDFVFLLTKSHEDQKKWLNENIGVKGLEISGFSFSQQNNELAEVTGKLNLNLKKLASVSNKRLFLNPNLFNKLDLTLPVREKRVSEILVEHPVVYRDTIRFFIPDVFYPEFLPEATSIVSDFGEFSTQIVAGERNITYIRRFQINKGQFAPEKYEEFVNFINSVNKVDKEKIVLKNKT